MSNMYATLMMDIKKSKSYVTKERLDIQNYLIETCNVLNGVFRGVLEKRVEFSAGDELQGLFSSSAAAYLYYRLFAMLIFPVQVRAGIGAGEWEINIPGRGTTVQDGQVYHYARQAIEDAEKADDYDVLYYSGSADDYVINSLMAASAGLMNRMSMYQNDIYVCMELLSPLTLGDAVDYSELWKIMGLLKHRPRKDYAFLNRKYDYKENLLSKTKEEAFPYAMYPVKVDRKESMLCVTSGRQRGVPVNLSSALNISRQSVEKTIKTANLYVARNMSITALKVMIDK